MSDLLAGQDSIIIKKLCIGINRYTSARGKAMYLNCIDSYPENDDQSGQFPVSIRCEYDDFRHFYDKKPSVITPMVITAEGRFQTFAGQSSFVCSQIVDVTPFKFPVKEPEPGVANKSVTSGAANKPIATA